MEKINELLSEVDVVFENAKYFYEGNPVPRVTEIISKMISEEYLMNWANRLGFKHKNHNDVKEDASKIGSATHDMISLYFNNMDNMDSAMSRDSGFIPFLSFLKWWDIIKKRNVRVLASEKEIVCQWYGGTFDLIMSIDGKVFLVDFKTSNHVSYKYFLQLAAYIHVLAEQGVKVNGCIILQLDKKIASFEEYTLDFTNPEHYKFMESCHNTFFSLLYGYYQINESERYYNNIFNKG